jgi:hypothetical protein
VLIRGYTDGAVRYICAFASIYIRCLVLICIDLFVLKSISVNVDLQITNVKCFLSIVVNLMLDLVHFTLTGLTFSFGILYLRIHCYQLKNVLTSQKVTFIYCK